MNKQLKKDSQYKVFVDDSGWKEYINPYSRDHISSPPDSDTYPDFWRKNYFVLGGIRINKVYLDSLNQEINDLKIQYFGTKDVEIKSDWLRNPHQRKKRYLKPFKISINHLNKFGETILSLVPNHVREIKIFATVFDKRYFGDKKRNDSTGNPLLKSTQIFLERIHYAGGRNTIVFDQMESSLKLNKGSHKKMLNVFNNEEQIGEIFVEEFSHIEEISFSESKKENFLQLADLCAYNVFRQFVMYGRDWDGSHNRKLRAYKYFQKMSGNFYHKPRSSQVRGCGLVCIPDLNKVNWDLLKIKK